MNSLCEVLLGDCRETLKDVPDKSVQMCVTSPPYFGQRNYGDDAQLGLESTVEAYIGSLLAVASEIHRVMKDDGTFWLNIGDSMSSGQRRTTTNDSLRTHEVNTVRTPVLEGIKPKDLIGVPWRVAFALRDSGWYLRSDIIWNKPNPMPESVKDRPTKSHEHIFFFSKNEQYKYFADNIAEASVEGVRNRRDVWSITVQPYSDAHFATFPEELPRLCILAGSKPGDTVLDPFAGSGTTGKVALELGRKALLCELNPEYGKLIKKRTTTTVGMPI